MMRHTQSELCRSETMAVLKAAMTAVATMDADKMPKPCIANTDATSAPRLWRLENSAVIVADSGYSPPTPKPSIKRQMMSHTQNAAPRTADADVHWPIVATIMIIRVNRYTLFLPRRSPRNPKKTWPQRLPTRAAAEIPRSMECGISGLR